MSATPWTFSFFHFGLTSCNLCVRKIPPVDLVCCAAKGSIDPCRPALILCTEQEREALWLSQNTFENTNPANQQSKMIRAGEARLPGGRIAKDPSFPTHKNKLKPTVGMDFIARDVAI